VQIAKFYYSYFVT